MKLLITGSLGQVGRCLVEQLNSMTDVEFLALDREELDITDETAVSAVVTSFSPDVIINAAAHTAVDKAEEEIALSYAINRDGPANLAKAADKVGAAMLHISTDYVFAGNKDGEYVESDETGPQGVYGESKLAGEIAVAQACERHIILRTAWVFSEHGGNFVKSMLRLAQSRDTLGIVADQFGGPTYAGDIASALLHIAVAITKENHTGFGIYHYSGMPHVSWYDFANTIFAEAKQQGVLTTAMTVNPISTADYPTPAKRPANSKLNNDKIHAQFGIHPSDWQLALKNLKDYAS
ncbi:dTDP-4-dehydrorhamnose reductase [Enterovibrio sp. ZSDZ35]|uniref:dTDP-4-dehydrorhamnose reductase n=1 Tax=Enterovibrio qingdaonensis TaxID=2899818 RepID=A0ABT5QPS4_9GAMM|nr:dTDP-4-dehydrorhamnose reductase [Enterovibrio sp. ZSDZ35]MDD1782490.1 dTDP-4-dehydrorhamnose reductase [Enterovibrio sp. ZSDZ35]